METLKERVTNKEKKQYINLITERFLTNPRMSFLFDHQKGKKYYKSVQKLVEYCFHIALSLNGFYISKNKKTIVLFYEKKEFQRNKQDYLRYFKVLIRIKMRKLFIILGNEKKIKKNRLKIDNYIYVWFIAQEKEYRKLDGLIEINTMLFEYAKKKNIPILLETSNLAVLKLYKRAGFKVYKKQKTEEGTLYFFIDKFNLDKTIE
tara:strand:- start:237 stop:851 length:615 start_codon:yes stop_codon:yes gene_type:complete